MTRFNIAADVWERAVDETFDLLVAVGVTAVLVAT